ncbi:Imm32 family immunity protein [Streptomyces mirabilis]|uniref:Imm32 family immunity protein n=1 Tax=Streptomyces mirabilis TaxID=68239 RepID=UPI003648AB39
MRVVSDPGSAEVDLSASAEDGGHLHIDYFPGHFYLAEGSLPLVVNSPHGGMPTR